MGHGSLMSWPKNFPQSLADIPQPEDQPGRLSIWLPGLRAREMTCPVCEETADLIWFTNKVCRICRMKATYETNLKDAGLKAGQYRTFTDWVETEGWKERPLKAPVLGTTREVSPAPILKDLYIPIMAYDDYLGQAADAVGDDWDKIEEWLYFHAYGRLPD